MTISPTTHRLFVVIPWDEERPLRSESLQHSDNISSNDDDDDDDDSNDDDLEDVAVSRLLGDSVRLTLLVRPGEDRVPGLYAYSASHRDVRPNVRATRLAMACGILDVRFRGDVLFWRHFGTSLDMNDIAFAACHSPDLRRSVQQEFRNRVQHGKSGVEDKDDDGGGSGGDGCVDNVKIPHWLASASQQNYHDRAILSKFATAMVSAADDDDDDDGDGDDNHEREHEQGQGRDDKDSDDSTTDKVSGSDPGSTPQKRLMITKVPLCLHCRRPSDELCVDCGGAYFCSDRCRQEGYDAFVYTESGQVGLNITATPPRIVVH